MTKYHFNRIVHYIPPAEGFLPIIHEFVEPNPSDHFIHWLFRYRCMECKKPGQEVNEIILRSRSNKSILDWRNRVLLCRVCHDKFHHNGVTPEKIERMQELRKEYLLSIDRGQYVNYVEMQISA